MKKTFSLLLISTHLEAYPYEDIDIHADYSVECFHKENMCVATGKAWAKKGSVMIRGHQLKIYFSKKEGSHVVTALEAIGNAILSDPSGTVQGGFLRYDVNHQTLEAKGGGLSLKTPRFHLTAQHSLRYCHQTHQGEAVGHARFTQDKGQCLTADRVIATFTPLKDTRVSSQSLELKWVKARGHVCLSQGEHIVRTDQALYDAIAQKAYLQGHVSILHSRGFAQGERGIYDLKTKRATLTHPGGRIRFLVMPQKLKPYRANPL